MMEAVDQIIEITGVVAVIDSVAMLISIISSA